MALLAAYAFDENTGTTAADASGNGHTLTFSSGTWAAGHTGAAIQSSVGSTDGATCPLSGPTAACTVMAWIKRTSSSTGATQPAVLLTGSGGGTEIAIFIQRSDYGTGNALQANLRTGGSLQEIDNGSMPASGTWEHVALTYDGATLTLYRNSVSAASGAASGSIDGSSSLAVAGQMGYGAADVIVDDIRIYDTALTLSQITTCMNTPVGTTADPTIVVAIAAPFITA